jgi:porphobilinogen synthase
MIDGTVRSIRTHLDLNGFEKVSIMNYSVKYKSSLYEPFRDAADSSPSFGDRSQYQMDSSNRREAVKKVKRDIDDGVDIIMVKPSMFYQDVIRELRDNFELPICAYQVSGEYSMIHNAAANNLIDLEKAILESLLSIKRSGADLIITYFAREISRTLNQNGDT